MNKKCKWFATTLKLPSESTNPSATTTIKTITTLMDLEARKKTRCWTNKIKSVLSFRDLKWLLLTKSFSIWGINLAIWAEALNKKAVIRTTSFAPPRSMKSRMSRITKNLSTSWLKMIISKTWDQLRICPTINWKLLSKITRNILALLQTKGVKMKREPASKSMSVLVAPTSSYPTCTPRWIPMASTAMITMRTLEIQSLLPHSKRRTKWQR